MGISEKALKAALPKGQPWKLPGSLGAVITVLSLSIERVRVFLRGVLTESNPGTAEDTLEQWYESLGLSYDETQTLANRQKRARQEFSAIGGVNKDYIEDLIHISYPGIELQAAEFDTRLMTGVAMAGRAMASSYPSWIPAAGQNGDYPVFYYRVLGEVQTVADLSNLQEILERISIAEQEPVFEVSILGITATAQAGLAIAGIAEAGKE